MFGAIGRWFRSIGYLFTGRVDSSRARLDVNPHVMRAKYDDIIRQKTSRIHQYKQALAGLIVQQTSKMAKIKELTSEVQRFERLKTGALAKATQSVETLKQQGMSLDQIKMDEDYKRCLAAFNDFSSTLKEKQAHIAELEEHIEEYRKSIQDHKGQLQELLREVENLKSEKADAVADVISAKEEREIADTLSGIAQDNTSEELTRLRQLRHEARAMVNVSKQLAGTEHKNQESEFLEYASKQAAASEFDTLIGLAETTESEAKESSPGESSEKTALPE